MTEGNESVDRERKPYPYLPEVIEGPNGLSVKLEYISGMPVNISDLEFDVPDGPPDYKTVMTKRAGEFLLHPYKHASGCSPILCDWYINFPKEDHVHGCKGDSLNEKEAELERTIQRLRAAKNHASGIPSTEKKKSELVEPLSIATNTYCAAS